MAANGSPGLFLHGDPTLPAFWSLSSSSSSSSSSFVGSGSGSRSRSESHNHQYQNQRQHHQDLQEPMDSSDLRSLNLSLGLQDWGADDFFIARRSTTTGSGPESESNAPSDEFSRACPLSPDGSRILAFESESDTDEQIVAIGDDGAEMSGIRGLNLNLPCWDCLQIDEEHNDEFEWEEIDARLESREAVIINSNRERELDREEAAAEMARNIEWEVLLMMNDLPEDADTYFDEGFVYTTSDYDEVLIGQFHGNHGGSLKGSLPAAKSAVESLPTIIVDKNSCFSCAVCKDDIGVEEKGKMLPCSHCYHEECILPWLEMKNTCPLCRYELLTDDPEYESWKTRRAAVVAANEEEEPSIRYDFEMLSEA